MSGKEELLKTIGEELKKTEPNWLLIEQLSRKEVDSDEKRVRFSIDASHIQRLGIQLVAKQETAVAELIKNAYDADASKVFVEFKKQGAGNGQLIIKDNGTGMSSDVIRRSWMRISTTEKQDHPVSPRYGRLRAGKKGIGRFAVQRLGQSLILETAVKGESKGTRVFFEWDNQFEAGQKIDDIFNQIEHYEKPLGDEGTALHIGDLRDVWTESALKRIWKTIVSLQSPFTILNKSNNTPSEYLDPGFEVTIDGETTKAHKTSLDLESTFLNHACAEITGQVDTKGNATVKVVSKKLGLNEEIPLEVTCSLTGPFQLSSLYFIYKPELLSGINVKLATDMGREYGGIRIYRDGFRVAPYGERSDDWLGLDWDSARRANTLAPAANHNLYGLVSLNHENNPDFEETSSREGLIENEAFEQLKEVTKKMLVSAINRIASARGRKQTASQKDFESTVRPRKPSEVISEILSSKVDSNQENRTNTTHRTEESVHSERSPTSDNPDSKLIALQNSLEEIKLYEKSVDEREAFSLQYEEMLRILAALGLSVSVFSHEIKGVRSSVSGYITLLNTQINATGNDKLRHYLDNLKNATDRMFDLGGYIGNLVSSIESRKLQTISLKGAIERFKNQFKEYLDRQKIQFEYQIDPVSLRTTEMHASEIDSVLLNFLTNSIKSMKIAKVDPRRIKVTVNSEEDLIVLSFQDNGIGIKNTDKDRVFDAFYTTTNSNLDDLSGAGTGLGLKIVRDIASCYGGSVSVEEPSDGYNCNIEFRILSDRS